MEWKHLVVTPSQNTAANGYGAECNATAAAAGGGGSAALLDAWARHAYRVDHFPSWAEAKTAPAGAFIDFGEGLLNVALYKRRMRLSVEPFLLERTSRRRRRQARVRSHRRPRAGRLDGPGRRRG